MVEDIGEAVGSSERLVPVYETVISYPRRP
jgi:hypothetical protein